MVFSTAIVNSIYYSICTLHGLDLFWIILTFKFFFYCIFISNCKHNNEFPVCRKNNLTVQITQLTQKSGPVISDRDGSIVMEKLCLLVKNLAFSPTTDLSPWIITVCWRGKLSFRVALPPQGSICFVDPPPHPTFPLRSSQVYLSSTYTV